jgi:hypothetical protein
MSMTCNFLRVSNSDLDKYLKDSSILEEVIYDDKSEYINRIEIDSSWDGIIFLLTGDSFEENKHPLAKVILGGKKIDKDLDFGYDPARYLTSEQVKNLYDKIHTISIEELTAKYDADKMIELEVYPEMWNEVYAINYLIDNFKKVQNFYKDASQNDEAIIMFID